MSAARTGPRKVSAERRRRLEERAKDIRVRGQLEGWRRDRIVDEIVRALPDILPLEAHRLAYGWTRLQLSRALDGLYERGGLMPPQVSPSEICGWEHGRHQPNAERRDYLARVYWTRPDRLGFGTDYSRAPGERGPGEPDVLDMEETDMDRRTMIKLLSGLGLVGLAGAQFDVERIVSAGFGRGQPGASLLRDLRAVTYGFAARRQAVAPGALLSPVTAHLRHLRTLLRETSGEAVRRELGSLTGETAVLAGWVLVQQASLGPARAQFAYARRLAAELDDRALAALTFIAESELHSPIKFGTTEEDMRRARELLAAAAATPVRLPAPIRAKLAAQQAEEHAMLKEAGDADRALERAREAVAEVTDHDRAGLFGEWSEVRLANFEGTCNLLLDRPVAAIAALQRALDGLEPRWVSLRMAARIDMGAAIVAQGDPGEGARIMAEAFEAARDQGRHAPMWRALRARERMERWKGEPALRDLGERMLAV